MILTNDILLIEPVGFEFNSQTAGDNVFQHSLEAVNAMVEFNHFRKELEEEGLNIHILTPHDSTTPDAVFPNNWFSTFPDGKLVIYPMKAKNRRAEKRSEFIDYLKKEYKTLIDLSKLEDQNEFLEGTGSLVIDHSLKIAFVALSERSTLNAIHEWETTTGYRCIVFEAADANGKAIYHTNVLLALTTQHAIVCLDAIKKEQRSALIEELKKSNRTILEINFDQMNNFCGNCLQLVSNDGEQLLILSERAFNNFSSAQIEELEKYNKLIISPLEQIENVGGGSARCMVAELFMPGAF
jgi:hypothetical protein